MNKLLSTKQTHALNNNLMYKDDFKLALKQDFDLVLMGLGFYPAKINSSTIAIADPNNNRELHFELDTKRFLTYTPENFPNKIPNKIANAIKGNTTFFDRYEILKPEESADPFLFGIKDNKKYFICCWDINEWDFE